MKEKVYSETLGREIDVNQKELDDLKTEFEYYKRQLDEMNEQYENKLKELEEIRIRANADIKQLSNDYSQVQNEINVVLLELYKYDTQVEFLMNEREMIMQA